MNKRKREQKGFVLVIVVFLISFILGCFFIDQRIIKNKSVSLRSKLEGNKRKENINNKKSIVFYELAQAAQNVNENSNKKIEDHFTKNEKYERLWQKDNADKNNMYSLGGYKLVKIIQGREKEIYNENSGLIPKDIMQNIIKGGKGYKFDIILEKKIKIQSASGSKEIELYATLRLEYLAGNKDIYTPDVEELKEMEVNNYI